MLTLAILTYTALSSVNLEQAAVVVEKLCLTYYQNYHRRVFSYTLKFETE